MARIKAYGDALPLPNGLPVRSSMVGQTSLWSPVKYYHRIPALSIMDLSLIMHVYFFFIGCQQIVNAFATQTDPEMKSKVISRLHNISQLQATLKICLAGEYFRYCDVANQSFICH